jgi:TfoX/Sxy family transcriptional regulator of competence genes
MVGGVSVKPSDLQRVLQAAAPSEIDLQFKSMFGGIGVYADGRMFCSLSDIGLALKFDGEEHAAFLKVKGAKPLQYEAEAPPSKSYIVVPAGVLKERTALRAWIARSVASVKSKPAKRPPPKSGKIMARPARGGFRKT